MMNVPTTRPSPAMNKAQGKLVIPDSSGTRKIPLRISSAPILVVFMTRGGFLDPESRKDLIDLARDGSAAHRLGRRANAVLLLDDGMTCEATARVLFVDDDTVRTWYQDYQENGVEGLANFGHEGGACRLRARARITASSVRSPRGNGVVPLTVEESGFDVEGCHLVVGDLDALLISVVIKLTGDGEAGVGGGAGD
jgi:hypothetical protein